MMSLPNFVQVGYLLHLQIDQGLHDSGSGAPLSPLPPQFCGLPPDFVPKQFLVLVLFLLRIKPENLIHDQEYLRHFSFTLVSLQIQEGHPYALLILFMSELLIALRGFA